MNRTDLDGVPVLWEQGPLPFSANLVFGVGARHESFRTLGVTHLVEHLVMGTLGKSALDRNAEVDLMTTTFYATGPVEAVVDFLHRVCGAISDLPLGNLIREAGVLDAEGASPVHPALAFSLLRRYGHQAQGLAGSSGPGHTQLTAEHVTEHVRRHFTRQNAVLVLTGPPPPDLRLELPEGSRVPLPVADALPGLRAGWCHEQLPVLVLSGLVDEPDVGGIFSLLLRERVEDDLRTGRGVSYEIDASSAPIKPGQSLIALYADTHKDQWDVVAQALWAAVDHFARQGPDEAEMQHAKAVDAAMLSDPRGMEGWLCFQAARLLVGLTPRTREQQLQVDTQVGDDAVRRAAAQMLATALMLTPEHLSTFTALSELSIDGDTDPDVPEGIVYRRRGLTLAPLDLKMSISDAGFSLNVKKQRLSALWQSVVGVAVAEDLRGLLLVDGRMAPVPAPAFKNGDRLLADIDVRLADLRFDADADSIWA